MKEIILIKNGEIALKGLNRNTFEQILIKNIKKRIAPLGDFSFHKSQSTIYITPVSPDIDIDKALDRLSKVFGIASLSRVAVFPKNFSQIKDLSVKYLKDQLSDYKSFRVRSKRSDKKFPLTSPEISKEMGDHILSNFDHLTVDLHNPEVCIVVEIREQNAYVYCKKIQGAKGMPVGSSGKGLLLLSGGIDSPVAGHMMAKRGIEISAIHFISPPYTSERALAKVEELCEKMSTFCGDINLYCVHFTEIQLAIKNHCDENLFTIIMRRIMFIVAERLAEKNQLSCLITGESIGQVASQTLPAINCTNDVCSMPVLRPVIGMDKNEIINIAKNIDTYETSILPYEDCCTVFTPKHPRTKPLLDDVIFAQDKYDFSELIENAINSISHKLIGKIC